jgi:regulatory protein
VRRPPKTEARAAAAEAGEDAVRTAALALLAGRDFSRHELATRLRRKGFPGGVVEPVLRALVEEGVLREERYAGQFVIQHAGRGRGPVRIRMELRQKGVAVETVDGALDQNGETDWVQVARVARRRKFGAELPSERRERAKQARFLQYRGFSADQIRAALGPDEDGDSDHDAGRLDHDGS